MFLIILFLSIGLFVLGLLLGGFCVNYILFHIVGQTIPIFWATLLAIFTGDICIPIAIFVKVLVLLEFIK